MVEHVIIPFKNHSSRLLSNAQMIKMHI